jgi:hypothetical protein
VRAEEIAEKLRAMIRAHVEPPGGVRFQLNRAKSSGTVREGVFQVGDVQLKCSLLDLPQNVESYTTSDRVNLYKSADIGQVLET